jgi:hypothetical protein
MMEEELKRGQGLLAEFSANMREINLAKETELATLLNLQFEELELAHFAIIEAEEKMEKLMLKVEDFRIEFSDTLLKTYPDVAIHFELLHQLRGLNYTRPRDVSEFSLKTSNP